MILILEYSPVMDQTEFLDLLIEKIQEQVEDEIKRNKKKLIRWDDYLDTNLQFKQLYNKDVPTADIIEIGVKNLINRKVSSFLYIMINPNIMLSNRLSLSDFCNMVEQGNLEMDGVDIFSTVFQNVKKSIDGIILAYQYQLLEKVNDI